MADWWGSPTGFGAGWGMGANPYPQTPFAGAGKGLFGSQSPVQQQFHQSQQGADYAYNEFVNALTGNQPQNAYGQYLQHDQSNEWQKYTEYTFAHPDQNTQWTDWLAAATPRLHQQFANLSPTAAGINTAMAAPMRALW